MQYDFAGSIMTAEPQKEATAVQNKEAEMLSRLLEEARRLLAQHPAADQVIAAAAEGRVYGFANHRPWEDHTDEDRFLAGLTGEDPRVLGLVCMWNNGGVDLPSIYLRRGLLNACPENAETKIVVQTENGLAAMELRRSMPPMK